MHKLLVHPAEPGRLYQQNHVGVYRSSDHGESWQRIDGAPPTEMPDFGGNDAGKRKKKKKKAKRKLAKTTGPQLPHDFGFGLALNANDPNTCYVIPLEPMQYAFRATGGALNVYRLRKNGKSWKKLSKGLPQKNAYVSVLRQAMASDPFDPCGVYFGTAGGQIFGSNDEGESWSAIAEYLPPIYSVSAAVI